MGITMSETAELNGNRDVNASVSQQRPELKATVKPQPKPPAITERDLLQLHQRWQVSLDAETLVSTFAAEIRRFVPYDSFDYSHQEADLHLTHGSAQSHRCNYNLILEDFALGALELTRNKRFSEDELYALERALGTFVYNLRNALNYRKAVEGAYTDTLTGMLNRNALDNLAEKEIKRSLRSDEPLSMLIIDIDHFKQINDKYGHQAGDQVLAQVAQTLEANIRASDLAFRHGGEEFLVLLPDTQLVGAQVTGDKVRAAISKMAFIYNGAQVPVTISVGATTMQDGDNLLSLTLKADTAMYEAKQAGRNCLRMG